MEKHKYIANFPIVNVNFLEASYKKFYFTFPSFIFARERIRSSFPVCTTIYPAYTIVFKDIWRDFPEIILLFEKLEHRNNNETWTCEREERIYFHVLVKEIAAEMSFNTAGYRLFYICVPAWMPTGVLSSIRRVLSKEGERDARSAESKDTRAKAHFEFTGRLASPRPLALR